MRLQLRCVKARDFSTPEDSRIQLFPFVEDIGDFAVLEGDAETTQNNQKQNEAEKIGAALTSNPKRTFRDLAAATGIDKSRIKKEATKAGWIQNAETSTWEKQNEQVF